MLRRLLRGPQQAAKPQGLPEGPQGRAAGGVFFARYALIYARKPSNKVRLNTRRTSKRRVSYLGMSWRRNELITLTLLKLGVARTVCNVINNCFQLTANTKTCLLIPLIPINNYGEYRTAPFNLFSAATNGRKCLKKSKSLRRIARANFFLSTRANRKIDL